MEGEIADLRVEVARLERPGGASEADELRARLEDARAEAAAERAEVEQQHREEEERRRKVQREKERVLRHHVELLGGPQFLPKAARLLWEELNGNRPDSRASSARTLESEGGTKLPHVAGSVPRARNTKVGPQATRPW